MTSIKYPCSDKNAKVIFLLYFIHLLQMPVVPIASLRNELTHSSTTSFPNVLSRHFASVQVNCAFVTLI